MVDTIINNENKCIGEGAHLWWPESLEDLEFVRLTFKDNVQTLQVGFKSFNIDHGVLHTDGTWSPGLQFFTHRSNGAGLAVEDSYEYMNGSLCVVFRLENMTLATMEDCPSTEGICRMPLARGSGFQGIGSKIDPDIVTSMESLKDPVEFAGSGPFHFHLSIADPSLPKLIDFELASPIVVSGFQISTVKTQYLQRFKFHYARDFVIFPDKFHELILDPESDPVESVVD